MLYLEVLRVRRGFVWYLGMLALIAAFAIFGALAGDHAHFVGNTTTNGHAQHVDVNGLSSLGVIAVPVQAILAIAGMLALLFSTTFAASFNRTSQHAHFTFVRPLSRLRMALSIVSVDVAAILVANLAAVAIAFVAVSGALRTHARFDWGADSLGMWLLGLGCAVMWYGVLQAVSAWTADRRGSGLFVGLTVAALFAAPGLAQATFLGPLTEAFKIVLFIDPIAYFSSVNVDGHDRATISAYFTASLGIRTAIVWVLAAVALALATYEWKRVQI